MAETNGPGLTVNDETSIIPSAETNTNRRKTMSNYKTNELNDAKKIAAFCRAWGYKTEITVSNAADFAEWMLTVIITKA